MAKNQQDLAMNPSFGDAVGDLYPWFSPTSGVPVHTAQVNATVSSGVTDHAAQAKEAKPVQKSKASGQPGRPAKTAKPVQKSPPKATATKPPLGSGARFQQLTDKLTKGDVQDPAALAASIGRKKYGASHMAQMAAAGQKKGR